MSKPTIMTIFGTRPEAIKMAPVIKKLNAARDLEHLVTVTAQHREMLDQVLSQFGIESDFDLDIMKKNQSLSQITTAVLEGLEEIYREIEPELVLVHGDTSTTFVGALTSFYHQIQVGHVEAGLRTYNKFSPFPEEMNRHLTGVIADLHFAPTIGARRNLLSENIDKNCITVTGNTVIDALQIMVEKDFDFSDSKLKSLNFQEKKIILLTAHRRENLGKPMKNICKAVREIIEKYSEVEVVFPVHLNPKIRKIVNNILGEIDRIHLIEPLPYRSFVNLMARSYLVLTDSGGIQEEAPGLGKPVLLLRDTTERPEALKAGTVKKVGTDRKLIRKSIEELLNDSSLYQKMSAALNPYGDGNAASRVVSSILYNFGLKETEGEEFEVNLEMKEGINNEGNGNK